MIRTLEAHHQQILITRRFWQMENEWTQLKDEDTTAVLRRILSAREERFYEKPPWERPSWPAARKRLPDGGALQSDTVTQGEVIYMATTLQRASADARIRLGDWRKIGAEHEARAELLRALWRTSTRQTGHFYSSSKEKKSNCTFGSCSGRNTWKSTRSLRPGTRSRKVDGDTEARGLREERHHQLALGVDYKNEMTRTRPHKFYLHVRWEGPAFTQRRTLDGRPRHARQG